MILSYGDTNSLGNEKWYLMEIRSEKTAENTLRRIGHAMPIILGSDGAGEVFVPLEERDLNVYNLKTSSYIFIRSNKKRELLKFRTITGVMGLLCEGEQQRLDKAIQVENEYVQGVIAECEKKFLTNPLSIKNGSFVRILDGLDRGFCGVVRDINQGYALVVVELKTRRLLIETPLHNLKDLGAVPLEQQVFYYCDTVKDYVEEFTEEALMNLEKDLHYKVEVVEEVEEIVEEKRVKFGRQKTLTAVAKRLLLQGERDPKVIIQTILDEVKNKNIKRPKSIFILYFVLKQVIKSVLFADDPTIKSYRDIITKQGEQWRISPKTIKELDIDNLIPLTSEKPKNSSINQTGE